jgi:hypothetical protein
MVEFEIKLVGDPTWKDIKIFLKEGAITMEKRLTKDEVKLFDKVRQDLKDDKPKCSRCHDRGYTIEGMLNEQISCGCSR